MIYELNNNYPITFLCKIMNVNRSGYYKWKNRLNKENIYQLNRRMLTNLLNEEHEKHPSYGYHRLAHLIRKNTGWMFSDNLAHKCCKNAAIRSTARKKYKYCKPGHENVRFKNIFSGKWNAKEPLQIVVSDMTMLKHRGKNYEWTYILDTFDNSIISSHISGRPGDIRTYYECLNDLKLLTKQKTTPTVLHTDQGAVYSSRPYNKDLFNYNIKRSMSRVGTPTDNPIIESINGWIKSEIASDYDINEYSDISKFLQEFVRYYNNDRPAYALGYLSPKEYRQYYGFT